VKRVLACLACGLAISCAGGCGAGGPRPRFADGVFRRGALAFRVGELPPPWRRVDARGGDLAWWQPDHDAAIATTGTCGGHGDAPLGVLVNDLLIGSTAREVLLEETIPFDGREARHEVVRVRVDGVPVVYDVYVMKKDGCVYDLVLVAPPRSYDSVADTFVAFVADFHGGP
jgi:hypothetical protein